jgi:hypothetical protein
VQSHSRFAGAIIVIILGAGGLALGQANNGPVPIDKVGSRVGRFQVLLGERSPLSKPADVAQRTSQKVSAADGDYDLAKEPFEAFVPKSPAEDGKYGLMIPMPFPAHGSPPPKWIEVLEARHLIWLGDDLAGDGRAVVQRVGLALDAVHNAEKVWQIDPARVYVFPASASTAAAGIALYYPDVFQGQLCGGVWAWYAKINYARARTIFNTDTLPAPHAEQLSVAKSRSRFFFAGRENDVPGKIDSEALIVKEGYERAGFKHVKAIYLPTKEITVWSAYPAGWFEQGVQFLDAGAGEDSAQTAKSKLGPTAKPGTAAPPPPAAGGPDDATRKAASALSLARNYINAGQYDAARKKLQGIVQTYPGSPAAEDARKLLTEIQDK